MLIRERCTTFFRALVKSCYDMEFYREVRTRPWTHAFRYAAVYFLLLSGLLTWSVVPEAFGFLQQVRKVVHEQLPDGAVFEMQNNQFNTSLSPATEFGDEQLTLVVDSSVRGLDFPKSFEDRNGIFLGQDALFSQEADGRREIIPFADTPDFSVTKEALVDWLGRWGIPTVVVLMGFVWLFSFFFSLFGGLFFVTLTSLLALFSSRLAKLKLFYHQWLAVGLHAVTLPTLLDFLFSLFGLNVPFLLPVVYFMFIFAVLSDERLRPTKIKPIAQIET
ncbi:MAG: DUF1189 family protein [Patescibacteria group bacterium]